jgi:hypothetical protein
MSGTIQQSIRLHVSDLNPHMEERLQTVYQKEMVGNGTSGTAGN